MSARRYWANLASIVVLIVSPALTLLTGFAAGGLL